MALPGKLTEDCRFERLISNYRPIHGIGLHPRTSNMLKIICIILSLLCSLSSCEVRVQGAAQRMNSKVSSAVENAKHILGIDGTEVSHSTSTTPASAHNNRKLLDRIKKDFNEKILHVSERSDTDDSPKRKIADNNGVSKAPQMSAVKEEVSVKSSKELKNADLLSDVEKSSSALPDSTVKFDHVKRAEESSLLDMELAPSDVEHDQTVVMSKDEDKPKKSSTADAKLPDVKDLPERVEEYVMAHLMKDQHVFNKKDTQANLVNEASLEKDENGSGGSVVDAQTVNEDQTQETTVDDGSQSTEDVDSQRVPPVGSKLEQEVVSAIKVRAHSLSNTTIKPSPLADNSNHFFIDNGEKTLSKFPDPRHFFTNVSSKSFTWGGGKGAVKRTRSISSNGNSSSIDDFKKVIIFPKKKKFHADDGVDVKAEVRRGSDAVEAAVEAAIMDEVHLGQRPEKGKDPGDIKKPVEEVIAKEKKDPDLKTRHQEENEKEKKEEKSSADILPTNVISDTKEKKDEMEIEESAKDEDLETVDKKTKPKEGKGKKETKDDAHEAKDIPSEEKEKDASDIKEKSEIETAEEVEGKGDSKSEKQVDEKEEADKSLEEKIDTKDVKREGEEDEKLEVDEGKEADIDKSEDEKLEKKEKSLTDTEEPEKVKKQSDSKDKKKSDDEEDAKKTEGEEDSALSKLKAEGEEEKAGEEKSEDTLETYSQFTQRVSAEKKNDATNGHGTNGHSKGSKVKGKNYASPDCGAKLVTANPEASHTSKVIHPNKDEYMLNKCRDKIWFIIELCESIRPQKFDIANFELFSNLPKDIQVFGSHRYPTRDWSSFGWFKGQEGNRGLQSFRVETEDFFKYIKVEVTSNYGSEFYCPISNFKIFGLSEFEVIDTIEDQAEDTDDDNEPYIDPAEETTKKKSKEEGKQSVIPAVLKNMFSGVMDVIKRGYRPSSSANEPGENCYSLHPKFAVESEICPMAGSLNYILSCYNMEYEALMLQPFVSSTVKNSSFCRQLALTMCAEPDVNDSIVYDTTCNNSYVCVMLSPKHVLAMCFMQDPQIMDKGISCESGGTLSENYSATLDLLPSIDAPTYVKNADINTSSITRADALETNFSESLDFQSKKSSPEVIKDGKLSAEPMADKKKDPANVPTPESSVTESVKASPKEVKGSGHGTKEKIAKEGEQEANIRSVEPEEKVEVEGSGMGGIDISEEELPPSPPEESSSISPTVPSATVQATELKMSNSPTNKESVVVRLSNKIKALEYNMSISSQYLEELSRRYKRQMEEMQRQFNLTIGALNDTSSQAYERDQHHQRDIEKLEEHLANVSSILQKLVDERETLAHTVVEQHVLLMVVEVIVLCMVFTMCTRRRSNYSHNTDYGQTRRNQTPSEDDSGSIVDQDNLPNSDSQGRVRVRRRSVDSITSDRNSRLRQRRPSEEALNISGTYQDLLIIEPAIPILMDSVSDRKKKRKSTSGTLKRSKSNASIIDKSCASRRAKRIEKLNVSSAGVLFCGDEVDSKTTVPPPDESQVYASNSLDLYGLMHDPLPNDEGSVFYNYTENSSNFHDSSMITDLSVADGGVSNDFDCVSKRHSVSCFNCDNVQRKEKLSKSLSLGSAPEKSKSTQEKVKKVKKLKKAKIKDSVSVYCDTSQAQSPFPAYSQDYYYPKPNGISYCSPMETYDSYYYNGHNSVHFSDDTKEHCDHTYNRTEEISLNGGYSNGIEVCGTDHYKHNEFSHTNHDALSATDKKKVSPRVKSNVKLRSDNWEWYSSQHVGSSGSETISTCSDSSGKNRKVKIEEKVDLEKSEEKKGKRKKKSKSKSSSVLLEEETVLEVEAGT